MREISKTSKTLLISTQGMPLDDEYSIFITSKPLEIEKIIIVTDQFEPESIEFDNKLDVIHEHFKVFDIEVLTEKINFDEHQQEYLYLAKVIGDNLTNIEQIVIDSNNGPRYLRAIIQDSVSLVTTLNRSLFSREIITYEALKGASSKQIYFHFRKFNIITPQGFRVLKHVNEGMGEADIANLVKLRQSTVSTHLKNLRELGFIEGKSKSSRRKTTLGHFVLEIGESLSE